MRPNFYKFFICIFTLINTFIAESATEKYRLMIHDDPSTTITIGWNQLSGTGQTVHYGTTDHGISWADYPLSITPYRSANFKGMNNQFAILTGLTPNTVYYFVIKDSEGTSSRFWFRTLPNDSSQPLSIISGGDSRSGTTQRQNSNRMVAKIRPHAIWFGGDLTNSSSNAETQQWLNDWQLATTSDGQMFGIVHSYGNHEANAGDGLNYLYNLFDTPFDVYYKVNFGGDLISLYTLNGELLPGHTVPNATKRTQQKNWLAATLPTDNCIWKSAQYHRPIVPHEAGKGEGADEFNDWAHLFYDNGVRLVFESDAHVVKVTHEVKPAMPTASGNSDFWFTTTGIDPDKGITFLGEGSWGTLRTADDPHPFTKEMASFYQFNWLIIDECKIQVRKIDTQNPTSVPEHAAEDYFSISPELEALVWKPTSIPSGINEIIRCNPPTADFIADNTSIFTGETVNFTDLSTNTPFSWDWNFGDLNTSTLQNPSNTYATAGVYTVSLTATNAEGSGTETKTAYINVYDPAPPIADFTVSNTNPLIGETINFTDLSTNVPNAWLWNFGDGNTSTDQNPTYAYAAMGTFTVSLTATNTYGSDEEIKVTYITVNNSGSVFVEIANGNDDVEQNNNTGALYFTSTDLEFTRDGTFNQHVGLRFQNVNVPAGAVITNAYILMRADESHSNTVNIFMAGHAHENSPIWSGAYDVSTRPRTTGDITWSFNASSAWVADVTQPQTPDISHIVQEIIDLPGWTSGNSMSFIFWDNLTTTSKRVADSYEGGWPPKLIFEFTIPSAAPVVNFSTSTATICQGSSVNFSDLSSNAPTSWEWNFGDGVTSTLQNPTHNYTSPGTYSITLTASNDGGSNVFTQTDLIEVVSNPSLTTTPNASICNGESINISVSGADSYSWNNGLPALSNHSVSPTSNTVYEVIGTSSGCSSVSSFTISVDNQLNPGTANPLNVCESDASVNLFTAVNGEDNGGVWNDLDGTGNLSGNTLTISGLTSGQTYQFSYVFPTIGACPSVETLTEITIIETVSAGTALVGESTCMDNNSFNLHSLLIGQTLGGIWNDDNTTGGLTGSTFNASTVSAGNYQFTYTIDGGTCGIDNETVSITVNELPSLTLTANTEICSGETTLIEVSGADSYTWNNGLSSASSHSVSPTVTTTYEVEGNTSGCTSIASTTVTVKELPVISFNAFDPSLVCVYIQTVELPNASPVGGNYSGTSVSGNQFSPSVAGEGVHEIVYTYTDANNCTNSASQTIQVVNCLSVEENSLEFKIYPNPASQIINISFDNNKERKIIISSINGQIVYETISNDNPLVIDVEKWTNGTYQVFIFEENNEIPYMQKIIIQN